MWPLIIFLVLAQNAPLLSCIHHVPDDEEWVEEDFDEGSACLFYIETRVRYLG
jgi:hypothetical protein